MGYIPWDCPHCGTKSANFETLISNGPNKYRHLSMFAVCGICNEGIVLHLRQMAYAEECPEDMDWPRMRMGTPYAIRFTSPLPPVAAGIEAPPETVATAFEQAEKIFDSGHIPAAGMMFRRAIERAVRAIDTEGKGMLNQRIRTLEAKGLIPKTLIDLMDHVKIVGNDSAHDDIDPTKEDVVAARDFTRLLLTYLFELPKRVNDAKERREAAKAQAGSATCS